jgi:rhamnosyltransferase
MQASCYRMGENAGIAAAQNVGIAEARRLHADAIAFFDQDSSPNPGVLPHLISTLLKNPGAVVAPVCVDSRSGKEYPSFQFNRLGWAVPVEAIGKSQPLEVDIAISSGSLVPVLAFDRAGVMNEGLFIDYVDIEWCIRCRAAGVRILVQPVAIMPHAIGGSVVERAGFTIFVHSPARCYYRVRNALLLLRLKHVRGLYAFHEVAAALLHHALQWRHSEDRRLHALMGWRAFVDGAKGVTGPMRPSNARMSGAGSA